MPSELQSLSKLFNESLFRIPDYQRGYAWGPRQLADFWADLERAGSEKNHYCGQLTLELAPETDWKGWVADADFIKESGFRPLFVVDGQQRLTTALIFIQALLENLDEGRTFVGKTVTEHRAKFLVMASGSLRHCLFGYAAANPSHAYFQNEILGLHTNDNSEVRTLYTSNLGEALSFFRSKIEPATDDDCKRWFSALTQRFLFNVYELSTDFDVFVAFETMNNRGKPLTRLELLKNRLIYLSTMARDSLRAERDQVRRNVNSVWRTIYEELGREPTQPLDDDDFLRAHWIISFPNSGEPDPLTQFLLNKHFTVQRLDSRELKLADVQSYIDSLQLAVRCWHILHFPEKHSRNISAEVVNAIERLRRLGFGVFKPLFLAALARVKSAADQIELFTQAERFLLLARSFASTRSNVAEPESHYLARELFSNDLNVQVAIETLRGRVQRHFSIEKFQVQIDELFDQNGSGFYDLNGLHYVLFEYEERLRVREAKLTTAKVSWNEFRGSMQTIEHVYPQNATDTDWPAFAHFSAVQKKHICNSLGNLVAVTHSKNSTLKRKPFAEKVNGGENVPGFSVGSFSENRIAKSPDWTATGIQERGIELLEFIEERWQVVLGDRPAKLKLLKADIWSPPLAVS